ncbi:MAG: acetate/propionate family kinase [Pseudodonghicola sp.]|nr:acetate/propionate family kinase [Pseudodonghicola sp.]
MTDTDGILVINAGSSSVKFALYGAGLALHMKGELESIGTAPRLSATKPDGTLLLQRAWVKDTGLHALLTETVDWIDAQPDTARLAAVGHRVGIGGLEHTGPEIVTPAILDKLKSLIPLVPLHQPRNLEPIELLAKSHPHLTQVACFDTAFHRTLPHVAQQYGLPADIAAAGAQRYGFHGLSYEYISGRLAELDPAAAQGKTIVAHLGSGASLCALKDGKSIATTMGFSPLSGLVMGTRPGDLDPGLMIWLLRERGMSIDQLEAMLYHDSGLKGVSGISNDIRDLLASAEPKAAEAIALFVYKIVTEIGALSAALGGLDTLVFTAGIGEHSADIRARICAGCAWLGLRLSPDANTRGDGVITAPDSRVTARVIPTNEELMVARHTASLTLPRRDD